MIAATERGVYVSNIPSGGTGNSASCAEHAMYLALGLLRHQHQLQQSIRCDRPPSPAPVLASDR